MKKSLLCFIILFLVSSFMVEKPAYRLFDKKGKKAAFKDLLKRSKDADVILFGELHNNPMSHWLQLELLKELRQAGANVVFGAEMFEADDQLIIEEYFEGKFPAKNFEAEVKLWNNYSTDYKPLLEYCRGERIKFVATNIPRRYANYVSREGIEKLNDLSDEAKNWIAPLPIVVDYDLPGYRNMMEMMRDHAGRNAGKLVQAQAIKDATMAYFISESFEEGKIFYHINGSYHSNNFEGIFYYLKKYKPDLKVLTISTVEQEDVDKLDEQNKELADFIIAVPRSMIKTF